MGLPPKRTFTTADGRVLSYDPKSAPAIPEIAKAFQNDPRTALAQSALAAGGTTAPVAEGGYAWLDGLARVAQGVFGGVQQKRQMDRYARDEADLLDTRSRRAGTMDVNQSDIAAKIASAFAPQTSQPAPPPSGLPVAPPPVPSPAPASALQPPFPATSGPIPAQGGQAARPIPFVAAPARSAPAARPGRGPVAFVDPLAGFGRPTSGFGPRRAPVAGASTYHTGQDYAAPEGTPVRAAAAGRVIRAWNDTKNGGGNSVIIEHADGSRTGYAHLASFNVARNTTVEAGQEIGAVGSTGRATGPHLHLTYRDANGQRQNPVTALKFGEPVQAQEAPTIPGPQVQSPVGDMPLPPEPVSVGRPDTPEAMPATRSRLLDMGKRIATDGNRYESAAGQDMIDRGLSEQGRFDETAAERVQRLRDTGYQSDLNLYNTEAAQRNQSQWENRRSVRDRNWSVADREDTQNFQSGENALNRSFQSTEAGKDRSFRASQSDKDRAFQASQAALQRSFMQQQTEAEIQGRRDAVQEQVAARRQGWLNTNAGQKAFRETADTVTANNQAIYNLDQFQSILDRQKTGGFTLGNAPGLVSWSNTDLQTMRTITNQLALLSSSTMKGSLSDKDREFLLNTVPNISKTGRANRADIVRMKGILQRSNDYADGVIRAQADGTQMDFLTNWNAFSRSVPVGGKSYNEWLATLPRYDANGKRVN